jgi:hypothetical protein
MKEMPIFSDSQQFLDFFHAVIYKSFQPGISKSEQSPRRRQRDERPVIEGPKSSFDLSEDSEDFHNNEFAPRRLSRYGFRNDNQASSDTCSHV